MAAAIINTAGCTRPDQPVSPLDFVPKKKVGEVDLTKMSPEEQAQYMLNQFSKRSYRK